MFVFVSWTLFESLFKFPYATFFLCHIFLQRICDVHRDPAYVLFFFIFFFLCLLSFKRSVVACDRRSRLLAAVTCRSLKCLKAGLVVCHFTWSAHLFLLPELIPDSPTCCQLIPHRPLARALKFSPSLRKKPSGQRELAHRKCNMLDSDWVQ